MIPMIHLHTYTMDPTDLIALGRDVWAVACNYREPTKIASKGARAFVGTGGSGSGYADVQIVVRSRGGRRVRKWERCRRLTGFRAACVPVGHPMRQRPDVWLFATRLQAEDVAASLIVVSRRDATARQARPRADPIA